ncbi:hypothetical protein pEaSNUABM37_00292 [Erwinia phage pEa_SNUABM_37]|nr:hypothetical protein pEaSNUABM37_00292 [Erwinia phage pEa_SNUABM_37]QXO10760.1 hypothetical protein pEaSNUABM48_00292 [Erwinia phage pEa_SNUABM_48]
MMTKQEIAYIAIGLLLTASASAKADTVNVNQCTTNNKDSVIVTQCSDGTVTVVNAAVNTVLICHTKDAGHVPVCGQYKLTGVDK